MDDLGYCLLTKRDPTCFSWPASKHSCSGNQPVSKPLFGRIAVRWGKEKKNSSKWIKMVHCANISSTYSTCHLTWPRDVGFSMVFLCSSACLDPHWSPTSAGLTLRQQQLAPPKTQRNRLPHPAPEQTWNLGWRIIRYHHQKLVILHILLLKRKPLKSLTVNSRWI